MYVVYNVTNVLLNFYKLYKISMRNVPCTDLTPFSALQIGASRIDFLFGNLSVINKSKCYSFSLYL